MSARNGLILIPLLFALASTSVASEKVFFGKWEPPASLREFWTPIGENWWNPDDNSRLYNYCKKFAAHSSPNKLMDDIISDLKKNPSVERTAVYAMVVVNWNHQVTLKLLKPYYKSIDPDLRKIADDFTADIEEEQETHSKPEK
jgi:hypothetical protein